MPLLLDLFLNFARIGLFTFGGGLAMLSLIEDYCVSKRRWITHEDMMDITVIAESTPGPIAINCATFVGFKQGGFWGALCATVGVVLPSFLVIYLISVFLRNFLELELIAKAFRGINIAVGILILNAAVGMLKKMKKNALPLTIMGCSFVLIMADNLFSLQISSILLMLLAGALGLVLYLIQSIGGARK